MIFNRFTRSARRCVEQSIEQAGILGYESVGDVHLLLGILATDEGLACDALTSLGITLELAHTEVEQSFADALAIIGISLENVRRKTGDSIAAVSPSPRRLPFDDSSKRALECSLHEAMRLGDRQITGEHILLGLLRNERGGATRILHNLGVSPEDAEERLHRLRTSRP